MSRDALSIVVLSFNRRDALRRTLAHLASSCPRAQVIVADNASTDGSAQMVRDAFPGVELVALGENIGVAGFNRAAERASREFLLILDDDSWPDPAGLELALAALRADERLGGIMLHRRHPATNAPEWPFDNHGISGTRRPWPDMGCGNLVRTSAWRAVGGYEEGYFLYRNDTDLALKLHAAGFDTAFNPAWFVWHDSPIVTRKSDRWLRLATRNWVWLARRHGRGFSGVAGLLAGCLHAHRLARLRPRGHWSALRGTIEGLARPAPPLAASLRPDGAAFRELVRLKTRLRAGG